MKLQWVLRRLPPPTPSTTTLLLPPPAQHQEEGEAGVAWPPPSMGQVNLGCYCWPASVLHEEMIGKLRSNSPLKMKKTKKKMKMTRKHLVKRVLNSKGTYKTTSHLFNLFTTSPTFWTATTTTSTLKCQSQKSWHSDLVCFLCNKRNFQKEFLFVFFLKDYSNFKRNYYFILVTLYCQYIWPVYLVHLSPKR